MKCPKCSYLGFEPADRCRNCGFDFSLAPVEDPAADLPLRREQPGGPLADFDLGDVGRPARLTPTSRAEKRRQDASLDPGVPPAPRPGAGDLPLFGGVFPNDDLLVRPAAPGAPLAVRRSTPTRSRLATPAREPGRPSDPSLPLDSAAAPPADPPATAPAGGEVAPLGRRTGAAALDFLMLLALDAGVVYFTLRVSRLAPAEIALLPPIPMAVFLLLLNGGYLTLFTAATGQTIGKMACGLRVVPADEGTLTVGRALLRVAALLASALPVGLGLLPVAFGGARRGLHDRLARTRVVRTVES
jgi:uncharacterized RDD family membrane protein YckC